jgi:hypothetical protein
MLLTLQRREQVFMQQHPHHATALLLQNPSLAQLLLHIEVLLDMVKPSDMAEVQAVFQQQQQLQQQQPPPQPQQSQPQHAQPPAPPQSSRAPPPPVAASSAPHAHSHASSASAPLIVTPAIAAALGLSAAQVQQTQMFLDMAPADLAALPAPVQDQIRMLRARIVELVSRR